MKPFPTIICLLLSIFLASLAQANIVELTASDGKADSYFGTSVAVRGNLAVVGAPDAAPQGRAYVFQNFGGNWHQVAKLTPTGKLRGKWFGQSVAVNDTGDTIVVGAPLTNGNSGAGFIFVEPAGGWTDMTETARLFSISYLDHFYGWSVAISGDGSKVLLGGDNSPGGVAVFSKPATGWVTTNLPTAELAIPQFAAEFGSSMAISGKTLVVAATLLGTGGSAAYVYNLNQLNGQHRLVHPRAILTPSDQGGPADLLTSVAISGSTIVAGAPNHNSETGAVYVFTEPASGWADMTQTAELATDNSVAGTGFGESVAVAGNLIISGAPFEEVGLEKGEIFGYHEPASGWVDTTTPDVSFHPFASGDGDQFGTAVAVDGKTIIVGARGQTVNGQDHQGAAYILIGQ